MPEDRADLGPLHGIRVIDMTSIVMGPLATQLLADLGADVIKIEPPDGDVLRKVGAPAGSTVGPLFMHLNRNKRSVVLDLKAAGDREKLLQLVLEADVVVHSMRPQAMERLKLSYDDIRTINPSVIYAGMFGFDQAGPAAKDAAFDDLVQAASGLSDLMGRVTDGRPKYVPFNLADRTVGLMAFGSISAALAGRHKDGRGRSIEIPMYETLVSLVLGDHLFGETATPPSGAMGYQRILVRNRGPFPTSDGHICMMVYTDNQWKTFLREVGLSDDISANERLRDIGARTVHAEELFDFVSEQTLQRSTAEWMKTLSAVGLPAVPMRKIEELLNDPQLSAGGFFQQIDHPTFGSSRLMQTPIRMTDWHNEVRIKPPDLGQHTDEVLSQLEARSGGVT